MAVDDQAYKNNLNGQKELVNRVLARIEEEYLVNKLHCEERLEEINLKLNTIDIKKTMV